MPKVGIKVPALITPELEKRVLYCLNESDISIVTIAKNYNCTEDYVRSVAQKHGARGWQRDAQGKLHKQSESVKGRLGLVTRPKV